MNKLLLLVFTVFPCFVLSTTQNEVILSAISSMFSEQMKTLSTPDVVIDESYTPQVETELGLVTGISLKEAHGFYSVPFAEARAEEQRFQKSRLINNFPNGNFNADVINQLSCYQTSLGEMNMTEDCLVLNIHVPKSVDLSDSTSPPNDNLPVIVWIHGGGFQTGAGTLTLYDGRYLSNVTNALVVSINYRLNAFGFLAITNGSEKICNQGFNDQQLALEWINKFIHNFGGDKDRVTLVGQSAGAQSVMFHLISSKSAPFFHRAIVSSQPAIFQYPTFDEALESTEYAMEESGCGNRSFDEGIECLRNASPEEMLPLRLQLMLKSIRDGNLVGIAEPFGMVLDGEEFTENPIQFVQNGRWLEDKRVAIMGSVTEEFNQIRAYIPRIINPSKEQFQGLLMHVFGDEIGRSITEKYDSMYSGPIKDYIEILGQVLTDGLVVCPTRTIARLASSYTNAYLYSFSHHLDDPSCKEFLSPESVCDYVFHSTDNIFLFRTTPLVAYNFSETDIQTADQMSYYWGNLAFSENPSSGDVDLGTFTEWPPYSPNSEIQAMEILLGPMLREPINGRDSGDWMNIVIDYPLLEPQSNYKEEICDFWDGTKYYVDLEQNSVTETSTELSSETLTVTGNIFTTLEDVEKTTTGGANSLSISSFLFVLLVGCKLLFSLD